MNNHSTGTQEEWLAARRELLDAEKELTRRSDELARRRQELPWARIEKEYRFETDEGGATLQDLFRGRSQLLVYHFMFGPEYTAGCPSCSAIADGFNGFVVHLENHDVAFTAVSRAPLEKLQAYKQRMEWSFPWASSFGSDFNYDFQVTFTKEQQQSGAVEHNFRAMDTRSELSDEQTLAVYGTDVATALREAPGMSGFALEDGGVPHTSSPHIRGRGDGFAGGAGHERVRARGRGRPPHLLGVHPRAGRPLGHVPVARPRATRAQRDNGARNGGPPPCRLGAPTRRIRQCLSWRSDAACLASHGSRTHAADVRRHRSRVTPSVVHPRRRQAVTKSQNRGPRLQPARTRPHQRRCERRSVGRADGINRCVVLFCCFVCFFFFCFFSFVFCFV